jgi:predicted nucleic acid-binding protein
MVLVDTSVWVSHLREGNMELADLLHNGEVASHPCVVGELACGNLKNRSVLLSLLKSLPMSIEAEYEEVLAFIERKRLMRKGLRYVDAHLITSAALTGVSLWTLDKRLGQVAAMLHLSRQRKAG